MTAWACIAAKDEQRTIGSIIRALKRRGLSVVVIDDGSEDHTRLRAENAGALVQRHETAQGIAPSLMEAWAIALRQGADTIIQLDAGGSHDPGQVHKLTMGLHSHDLVVGSRFCPLAEYVGNPQRALMSKLAATMCNLKTGQHITDWTSGYRAMIADAAILLSKAYEATMHGWQIETLAAAVEFGLKIGEAPIRYVAGRSTFDWNVAKEAFDVWRRL